MANDIVKLIVLQPRHFQAKKHTIFFTTQIPST
jgi:hypothetical protein